MIPEGANRFRLKDFFSVLDSVSRVRILWLFVARVLVNFIDIGAMSIVLILLTNISSSTIQERLQILILELPTEIWFVLAIGLFILRAFLVVFTSGLFVREIAKAEAQTARNLLEFEFEESRRRDGNPELAFGKLQSNFVTGLRKLFTSSASNFLTLVSESSLIFLILMVGFIITPVETGFLLVFGLLIGVVLFVTSHFAMGSLSKKLLAADRGVYRSLLTLSEGAEDIRSFGGLALWLDHLERLRRTYSSATGMIRVFGLIPRYFIETLLIGGLLVFVFVSPGSELASGIQLELVVILLLRLVAALVPLQTSIATLQSELGGAIPVMNRLKKWTMSKKENEKRLTSFEGELDEIPKASEMFAVKIDNLTGVRGNSIVFSPITHDLRSGRSYAVVGESGSGKSTLLNLILNPSAPRKGVVKLNGTKGLPNSAVHYMGPREVVFEGTVAENILLKPPGSHISREDYLAIERALERSQLLCEIKELGLELQSLLPDKGGLSTGQIQRLAIARVFLSPKPILLLDEPTSALDSAAQIRIMRELTEFARVHNRLLVYSAHSKESVEAADEVIRVRGSYSVDEF